MQINQLTPRGDVGVSWERHNGVMNLRVNIPFNTHAKIHTPTGVKTVGSGYHTYEWKEERE